MSRFEIPWASPSEWAEINRTFETLIERHGTGLDPVREIASEIEARLHSLFPLMAELCLETCPDCGEPCCRVATLWYNYQDLLFLHLVRQPVPESQPLRVFKEPCRYLCPRGCVLDRMARPWICTWYICPPQTARLRKTGRKHLRAVDAAVEEIKVMRKKMEEMFLLIISG